MPRMMAAILQPLIACLVMLVLATAPAHADDCADAVPPAAGVNNVWYCLNSSDTVFIFVHGLHSDSRGAWMHLMKDGTEDVANYWPALVLKDKSFASPSIFLAGFYSDIQSGNYDMEAAAEELFSRLTNPVGATPAPVTKKNLVFVAHSLGGILVRSVLTHHTEAFQGKRIALLLVASPSFGSDYATQLATISSIVNSRLVDQLRTGSDYLQTLDNDFKQLRDSGKLSGLVGKEIYEHQFIDLNAAKPGSIAAFFSPFSSTIASWWGKVIVTKESAARYFANPQLIPKSDHFTIAAPDGLNHLSHQKLVELYRDMIDRPAPECDPPANFRLVMDVKGTTAEPQPESELDAALKGQLPLYIVWRVSPNGDLLSPLPTRVLRTPETGFHSFAPDPPFPCPSETYDARIVRAAASSFQSSTTPTPATLCFTRSPVRARERTAFMHCVEGGSCDVDPTAPGLADPCAGATGWQWPQLIGSAHADTPAAGATHWEAPSLATLETLPAAIRPGYTELTVTSAPLPALSEATALSFAVTVNGMPIHIDGLPPHSQHLPFNGADGVRLTFALENLGFTGAEDGYERIGLELTYWSGKTALRTAHLERRYVSYRHAPAEAVKDADSGDVYTWSGFYRPAAIVDRFEVMLMSAKRVDKMREAKRIFDAGQRTYKNAPIVGVLRPPRADNAVYGMTFGLRLPSGQVQSSFDAAAAGAVCKWLLSDKTLPQAVRRSAYLYEFKAERFTDTADRGVYVMPCSKVM